MKILQRKKRNSGTPTTIVDSPELSAYDDDLHTSRLTIDSKGSTSKVSKHSLKKNKKNDDIYGSSRSLKFSFGRKSKKPKTEHAASDSHHSEISRLESEDEGDGTMFGGLFSQHDEIFGEHKSKKKSPTSRHRGRSTSRYSSSPKPAYRGSHEHSRHKSQRFNRHSSPSISDKSHSGTGAPANSEVHCSPRSHRAQISPKYRLDSNELNDKLRDCLASTMINPEKNSCNRQRCKIRACSLSPNRSKPVLPCGHASPDITYNGRHLGGINLNANPIIINKIISDGSVTKGFLTKLDAKEAEIEKLILENIRLKNKHPKHEKGGSHHHGHEKGGSHHHGHEKGGSHHNGHERLHVPISPRKNKSDYEEEEIHESALSNQIKNLEHQLYTIRLSYDDIKNFSALQSVEIIDLNKYLDDVLQKNIQLMDENNALLQYDTAREYERKKVLKTVENLHDENLHLKNQNSDLTIKVEAAKELESLLQANLSDMKGQAKDISDMLKSQSHTNCNGDCKERLQEYKSKCREFENKEIEKDSEILAQKHKLDEIIMMKEKLKKQLSDSDRHIKELLSEVDNQLHFKSRPDHSKMKSISLEQFEKHYSVLLDTVNSKIDKIRLDVEAMTDLIQSIKRKIQDVLKDNKLKSSNAASELKTILSDIEKFEKSHKTLVKS